MAVLEIHAIRSRMDDRIKYALNPEKTSCIGFSNHNGLPDTLTDAVNCFCDTAYEQMEGTKSYFGKTGQVLGYHFIQSFKPGEVTPQQAHEIGRQFAERCFGERFEVVIGTHTDKSHLHNHIIVNSVSFTDGHKYRSTPETFYELRRISDEICRTHGLSVIEQPKHRTGKHYAEWIAENEYRPTIRSAIREDIDVVLMQVRTLDEFWEHLRRRGYEIRVNPNRKYVAIRPPNGKRFIRLKSLGDAYTPKQLANRIAAGRGAVVENIRKIKVRRKQLETRKKYRPRNPFSIPRGRLTLRGIRALYWKYVYMLGKVRTRKAPRVVRGVMLDELRKLKRYTEQYYFLRDHNLNTKADITMYAQMLDGKITALTEERRAVYNESRKPDAAQGELQQASQKITEALRALRRERRICNAICGTAPEMRQRLAEVQEIEQDMTKTGVKQHESRERSGRSDAAYGIDGN